MPLAPRLPARSLAAHSESPALPFHPPLPPATAAAKRLAETRVMLSERGKKDRGKRERRQQEKELQRMAAQ